MDSFAAEPKRARCNPTHEANFAIFMYTKYAHNKDRKNYKLKSRPRDQYTTKGSNTQQRKQHTAKEVTHSQHGQERQWAIATKRKKQYIRQSEDTKAKHNWKHVPTRLNNKERKNPK